jgi:phage minor structural protein
MIKIFSSTDKIFTTNGDKVIKPFKAKIRKEDNGDYYLNLETSIEYIDYLVQGNIVVVPTPTGEQAFRIENIETKTNKIICKCWHIFYDTEKYLIEDSYVVDKNCNDAMDHLNNATETASPFTTISDVQTVSSFRCVRQSLYEAIQTLIERWGGHLVRDNFNISIKSEIGKDNGVLVRYKKNLKDITCKYDYSNVVTKLLPVGKNGVMLDEKYIYSDVTYDIPYTKTVSFTQEVNEDDYKDAEGTLQEEEYINALKEDLRSQATLYVNENKHPKVNYTLKANLEKITDVGDIVHVVDERLGIDVTTNVISYDFDCILEKYTEVEFGNFKNKLSDFTSKITSSAEDIVNEKTIEVKTTLENGLAKAQDEIWGVLGDSYVINEGDKILVVDTLPKEEAKNVLLINNGGIAFSQTGINGTFNSAWTIDGTLNMQNINVINLVADMIKGGTLKLGGINNSSGILEIRDNANTLIGQMTKDGLKMYGTDGSYVLLNNEVGFAGYDKNDNKIYWVDKDEFHQKKSVVEEEITLCNKVRFIPITIYDNNNKIANDGIGLVSTIS